MVRCPLCQSPCILTDVTEKNSVFQCEDCEIVVLIPRELDDFINRFRKEIEEIRQRSKLT